ncbi:CPBP family intramembrane glutamic endopeptidase [Spirosoma flavum]|uniref:CPBP family intramembrane glutamic endopeptidase n=1 Tax=Spirosoma flavum TaxID=2048557 RepID=A0ABW6AG34_9BACT
MNAYLAESIACLSVGILVFVVGRMRLIYNTLYIPLVLSSFIFIGFYGVAVSREFVIPFLGFSNKVNRLLFYDYGNGLIGLLPLALAILFIGKYLLNIDYNQQWSGTTHFNLASLKYGMIGGIVLAAIPLLIAASMGQKFNYKVDVYRYGLNCVTNLYEEIICRGLLLACCIKYWNRLAAVVWTSVVFGLAHGLTEKSIPIALGAGLIAWAVLKAKSLWAGWTTHQLTDMIVDTFLP